MPRKTPPVRYSKTNTQFICDKIREGMIISEIREKYPTRCPSITSLNRWRKKYPKFDELYQKARQDAVIAILDQCRELLSQPHLKPAQIDAKYECGGDKTLIKHYSALEAKQRLDKSKLLENTVKYFTPTKSTVEVEHKGSVPTIQVLDYSTYNLPDTDMAIKPDITVSNKTHKGH